MFQSTPPHRGRPTGSGPQSQCPLPNVSIHAPAQGATSGTTFRPPSDHGFQSTPPHRGRQGSECLDARMTIVSIHAPAQGATLSIHPEALTRLRRLFQSTPPHRGRLDLFKEYRLPNTTGFQSTPPHRGRRGESRIPKSSRCSVSIHAPAQGATYSASGTRGHRRIPCFNPRPRTGGDQGEVAVPYRTGHQFQSTPPHRGRPK